MEQFEANEDENLANEDDDDFNLKLEVLGEKDQLTTFLDTYKDTMDSRIGRCEKLISTSIKSQWLEIETKLTEEQHKRNRSIVKEII